MFSYHSSIIFFEMIRPARRPPFPFYFFSLFFYRFFFNDEPSEHEISPRAIEIDCSENSLDAYRPTGFLPFFSSCCFELFRFFCFMIILKYPQQKKKLEDGAGSDEAFVTARHCVCETKQQQQQQ